MAASALCSAETFSRRPHVQNSENNFPCLVSWDPWQVWQQSPLSSSKRLHSWCNDFQPGTLHVLRPHWRRLVPLWWPQKTQKNRSPHCFDETSIHPLLRTDRLNCVGHNTREWIRTPWREEWPLPSCKGSFRSLRGDGAAEGPALRSGAFPLRGVWILLRDPIDATFSIPNIYVYIYMGIPSDFSRISILEKILWHISFYSSTFHDKRSIGCREISPQRSKKSTSGGTFEMLTF